jgi:hapalindole biogenesis HpiC1 cyclase-like protein/PEP-CTERM motif-containing protein
MPKTRVPLTTRSALVAGSLLLAIALAAAPANANLILNGSFEDAYNTGFAGYGDIDNWTSTNEARTGKNPEDSPTGRSPFWDNGICPDGEQVAFIQNSGGDGGALGQTVTGLTIGAQYTLSLAYNCRYSNGNTNWGGAPVNMTVSIDGGATDLILIENITPVGTVRGDNPFHTVEETFAAAAASVDLVIAGPSLYSGSDGTLTFDNVQLTEVPEPTCLALLGAGGLAMAGRRRRQ